MHLIRMLEALFLIDFNADTYMHFLDNDIEADKIKYLIVTHSHQDHFYEKELAMRYGAFAHSLTLF